jgi:hypothetical protein
MDIAGSLLIKTLLGLYIILKKDLYLKSLTNIENIMIFDQKKLKNN